MTPDPILTRPTEGQLAAAIEENLYALFRAMATLPDSALVERDDLSYHLTFPTNPMFKGVWRTQLAPQDADAAIDETLAWFSSRQAPFLFWWTGASTTPSDLGERLTARGLIALEQQTRDMAPGILSSAAGAPGMVADLSQVDDGLMNQVPAGFTIEEAQDEGDLADLKAVLISGYGVPPPMAQAWVDASLGFGIGQTPWQVYIGRLNGEPVATHLLLNGAGVAGVYGIAVAPSARGQGIGAAITLKPLLDARAQGYRYAVLFSTEMAVRVYERIGFRDCGVRINRYLWRNTEIG